MLQHGFGGSVVFELFDSVANKLPCCCRCCGLHLDIYMVQKQSMVMINIYLEIILISQRNYVENHI